MTMPAMPPALRPPPPLSLYSLGGGGGGIGTGGRQEAITAFITIVRSSVSRQEMKRGREKQAEKNERTSTRGCTATATTTEGTVGGRYLDGTVFERIKRLVYDRRPSIVALARARNPTLRDARPSLSIGTTGSHAIQRRRLIYGHRTKIGGRKHRRGLVVELRQEGQGRGGVCRGGEIHNYVNKGA